MRTRLGKETAGRKGRGPGGGKGEAAADLCSGQANSCGHTASRQELIVLSNSCRLSGPFQKEICESPCREKRDHFRKRFPFVYVERAGGRGSVDKVPQRPSVQEVPAQNHHRGGRENIKGRTPMFMSSYREEPCQNYPQRRHICGDNRLEKLEEGLVGEKPQVPRSCHQPPICQQERHIDAKKDELGNGMVYWPFYGSHVSSFPLCL